MSNLVKLMAAHLSYTGATLSGLRAALHRAFDDADDAAALDAIERIELTASTEAAAVRQIDYARQSNHRIVDCLSSDYPPLLRQIDDFPLLLYCRGDVERLRDDLKIAVIGTRKPSYDGKKMCDIAMRYLAKWPYTVVSGLAMGIDSLAHRAALSYGCPTIAVLACPVDQVTPRCHLNLARLLIERGGLILSETPYYEATQNYYYVRRNRIISGLCKKVFIVEGARKSGSMTTAQHALEQNRDLYAMPGSVFNQVAGGTNDLIKNGAHVVVEPADLFVADDRPETVVKHYTHPVAQLLLERGQLSIEQISQMMEIPIHILLSELTLLECQEILKVTGDMVALVKD